MFHEIEDGLLHLEVVLQVSDHVKYDLTLFHPVQLMEAADIHLGSHVVLKKVRDDLRAELGVIVLLGEVRVAVEKLLRHIFVHGCHFSVAVCLYAIAPQRAGSVSPQLTVLVSPVLCGYTVCRWLRRIGISRIVLNGHVC